MTKDGAGETERNGRHDHEGLSPRRQRHRKQSVGEDEGEAQIPAERLQGLLHLAGGARDLKPETGELLAQGRQRPAPDIAKHSAGGGESRVHVRVHGDRPPVAHAPDHQQSRPAGYLCDLPERRDSAIRPPYPHFN